MDSEVDARAWQRVEPHVEPHVEPRVDPRVEPYVKVRLEDNIEEPDEDLANKASTTSAVLGRADNRDARLVVYYAF